MKKTINLLFVGLLLLAFTCFAPEKVNAIGEPAIQDITIKQGDVTLTRNGTEYTAPGYENLIISYSITNTNGYGWGPYVVVEDENNNRLDSNSYYINYTSDIYTAFDKETKSYTIKLCKDWECTELYDTYEFTVKYTKYNTIKDDDIWYTKIMQGSKEVALNQEQGRFELNNFQNIIFSVKAKNLDNDVEYGLSCANKTTYYTGSELMAGLNYTCIISDYEYDSFSFDYTLGNMGQSIKYMPEEDNYFYPSFHLYDDDNVKKFTTTMKYTNYSDIELSRVDDDYWGEKYHYLTLNKYLNTTDTMTIAVKGDNFENKNYNVELSILKGKETVYNKSLTVSGNSLNNGYDAIFSNFNPGTVSGVRYQFRITIDGTSKETEIEYIYSNKQITINKITQGMNETALKKVDGVYIADGFNNLDIDLSVSDYKQGDELYVKIANATLLYRPNNGIDLDINQFENETEEFTILLCADTECNTIYTFDKIKVKLTNFDKIKNQKVYFYNVTQGNNNITMNSNGTFNFNDKQLVKMMIKGENLVADANYNINLGDYNLAKEVSGSILANGVEISADPNNTNWISLNIQLGDIYLDKLYYDGTKYYSEGCDESYNCINFNFETQEGTYNKTYETTLKYKNYPSNEITISEEDWTSVYVINTKYHNSSNPLSYYIKGSNYENKNYTVNVKVIKDDEKEIYNHNFTLNGTNINNGTNLEITDLVLPFPSDIDEIAKDMYGMPEYTFYVSIDSVSDRKYTRYNSIGTSVRVESEIFFQNGKKNLSVFRGFGNSGLYDTNKDIFEKYENIYINFLGYGFIDTDEYNYFIEYGYFTENSNDFELEFPDTVKTGKITGKILNEVGVFVELNNSKKYKNPAYRFYIKKDNEVLAYTAPIIYTIDRATLGSVILTSENKDLYLKTGDYSYIATKSMPINVLVSGIGFDDNKDYEFDYCAYPVSEGEQYSDSDCSKITFKGKDLNAGTASITLDKEIDPNIMGYSIYIHGDGDDYFGQGGFSIEFVENKDLLPNISKYIIDDASDIIKNIKKNTSVEEFINNIEVAGNGTIKVFDKTGTTEVNDKLGTGMIGRVIDEYDRNVINIDIAVKGDITGDGNISITDLVKVKQHLAEVKALTGVYEVAGNVSDTGEISITDLVKMSKDVANIEELN